MSDTEDAALRYSTEGWGERYDACPFNEILFHNGVGVGPNWALALLDESSPDGAVQP